MWYIFFIMWISWAGKWTLRKGLENIWIENLKFIKSYVARPMRKWEIDWDIYFFISEEEFRKWVKKDEFILLFK